MDTEEKKKGIHSEYMLVREIFLASFSNLTEQQMGGQSEMTYSRSHI